MIKGEIIKLIQKAQETQIQMASERIEVLEDIQSIVKMVNEADVQKLVITYALANNLATQLDEELAKIKKYRIEVSKLKIKMN